MGPAVGATGLRMRCTGRCCTRGWGRRGAGNCTGALALRLEAGYGARAGEIAAQLAVALRARGRDSSVPSHYWQQAGDNAARRNAYPEAIAALTKGLALLATLPESPERTQRELTLQLMLGELLMAAKGMASREAGEAYSRAHTLCQQVGETPQLFRALWGLIGFHNGQAQLRTGEEWGQQLFDLAQRQHDPVLVQASHLIVGGNALYLGNLVAARAHLEQSLEISAVPQSSTPIFAGRLHPRVTSLRLASATALAVGLCGPGPAAVSGGAGLGPATRTYSQSGVSGILCRRALSVPPGRSGHVRTRRRVDGPR